MSVEEYKILTFYKLQKLYNSVKYVLYSWWLKELYCTRGKNVFALGDFSLFLIRNGLNDKFKIPSLFFRGKVQYIIDTNSKHIDTYKKFKFFCEDVVYVNFRNKTTKQIFQKIEENVNLYKQKIKF